MKRSREAFWWSLFSAGGVMAAMFIPVLVVVTGFVLPYWSTPEAAYSRVAPSLFIWIVRAVLFVVLFFTYFHCAHRIRHVVMDFGLHGMGTLLSVVCYGAALGGAVVTAWLLLTFGGAT